MNRHDSPRSSAAAAFGHLAAADVRLLRQWNDTSHPYPDQVTVQDLFDAQAGETPDRAALIFENVEITFAELQQRSNRLAHCLIEKGVSAETPVGVAMHRSHDAVIAMLAIMKAGGAYVPLDPNYPADRLSPMIEDADVGLILTGEDTSGLPDSDAELVDVHGFDGGTYPSASPAGRSTPDDTLYITFTSGSTGRPKGVQGTHRGAINRFDWQWQTYPFSEDEVCCQKTSLNFLDHLWETWGPLLKGRPLLIIPDEVVKDGRRFVEIMARHRIERLVTVPSLLGTLLKAFPDMGQKLTHLRFCTLSGERLTRELAVEFAAVLPDAVLLNLYGMSEASADATWYDQRWGAESDSFPIGRPLQNMRVYLLDDEQRPVPIGTTGEIYVGGIGVAKGYCGRPDLTAERFLPDPFVGQPEARMYRSGDLGRWLPDGLLEYHGRVDQQVKIHGVRMELGEIEMAARSLDEIDDAVLTAPRIGQDQQLVAYVTLAAGAQASAAQVRAGLSSRLPGYMVPARIVFLDRFPLNPHGKIDRGALPDPVGERPASDTPYAPPRMQIERQMEAIWQELLLIEQIGMNDSFFDLGGDSLLVIRLRAQLAEAFGVELAATDLFEYRTIRSLAARIEAMRAAESVVAPARARASPSGDTDRASSSEVAIIGMAGRFPGSSDLDVFWDNLANGVEGLRRLSEEELRTFEPDYQAKLRDPDFVPVAGTLDGVEMFDAEFFGIQPGEARTLDPQHRIWFEAAWQALENAGYAPGKTNQRIGVFAGSYMNTYGMYNLLHDRAAIEDYVRLQAPGTFMHMLNNEPDYLPTRTSHLLDLRGPAINVQTACSTSLVAVALACRAIANGDCEMALAGGVTVLLPQAQGYYYQEGGIRSVDGHCRPFDAAATGTLFTSGVGAVLLKGLAGALADGDHILAVVRGSAINNDGAHKASYMAPSIDGQVDVISDALRRAHIDPGTIGLVEAHGTATPLGDPIEVAALMRAYKPRGRTGRSVAIGSVKSNIGHTDAAAGVAGLIKAVLALTHGSIPPTLHFESPNPEIDLDDSPFYVPTQLETWPAGAGPRRAGVSSFGVGGTNAHVVLEEAPPVVEAPSIRPRRLLLLSARTETALARMRGALADHLEAHRPPLADVAYTLTVGRADFAHRWSAVAADLDEAIAALRDRPTATKPLEIDAPDVVMMLPGQGSQFVGMGRELYEHEPVYRDALDQCADTLRPLLELDLRDVLYPVDEGDAEAAARLTQTGLTQPAIFAVSYAMARLWMSWGVRPASLVGHSVGEYVAATLAGVFSLQDGLNIIAARAGLMQALPGGSMRAVRLSPGELAPYLGDGVGLAAVNTPSSSVVSGPDDAVRRFCTRMEEAGLDTIELHTSHAFHSEMMEPILAGFRAVIASVERRPPEIPIVSTVTGKLLTDAEAVDPDYWANQVRRPVRFSDAILTLHQELRRVYLEVGPGTTLSGAVLQHPNGRDGDARVAVVDSLGHPGKQQPALQSALEGLGKIWRAGVPVDRAAVYANEKRRRVPLPTYPFERQRHWVDPPSLAAQAASTRPVPADPAQARVTPSAAPTSMATDVPAPGDTGHDETVAERDETVADRLAKVFADLAGLDATSVDRATSFTDLGFDSLFLTGVSSQIRRQYAIRIGLNQLLTETPTVETLAAYIEGELDEAGSDAEGADAQAGSAPQAPTSAAEPGGPIAIPLLPNTARFMIERETPHPEHWNLGVLLTPTARLDPEVTRRVVAALLERHDALRLRISTSGAGYAAAIAPASEPLPFATCDLAGLDPDERTAAVERRADELQRSLDLAAGPLIRVELFELGNAGQRLLVVVHHLAFDQLSWRPFWEDFVALYDSIASDAPVAMPPRGGSFAAWARAVERYAGSEALPAEKGFWQALPWERVRPIPLDRPDGENTNGSGESVDLLLSPEETNALLRETPGVVRKADLIITALAQTMATWTGSDTVLIDAMGHGRVAEITDDIDPMDTVGFFISYTPLVLRLHESGSGSLPVLTDQLEPLLRRRLDFDLLRHMVAEPDVRRAFGELPRAQVLFNHYGRFDAPAEAPRSSMFDAAPESYGQTHSPVGIRYYPLAVASSIYNDRLSLSFVYSSNLHERSTIERLADGFRRSLVAIVESRRE